jgi:hypothetical protein
MPKRAHTPPQEAGFMRRIGSRAGFFVAAIGLVFAAYQVQGWKMPRLLAAVLIASMLMVAGIALFSIVWEAIKEMRDWRERRETSTAWIAAEPPGLLDYVPDMNRASNKFVRQMGRLNRDTTRVGKQTTRDARTIKWALLFGPRAGQLWANHSAKGILRSAVFIEKRSTHLRKTVDEFARAQEGQLTSLGAPGSEEERVALESLREIVASRSASTTEAIVSVSGYRDAVREFSQQNYSRALRVSNKRLAEQLDAVLVILRRSLKDSERLEALLERKVRP